MAEHFTITLANTQDREAIYRLRHDVYAAELGQHKINDEKKLKDKLDDYNMYVVAKLGDRIAGFVSVTPPADNPLVAGYENHTYSMDKYVDREKLPFPYDSTLYEIRVLTVDDEFRQSKLALLLMYTALRWIDTQGGKRVMCIGRLEVLDMYLKVGLLSHHIQVTSGAVTYEVLSATVDHISSVNTKYNHLWKKMEREISWEVDFPFFRKVHCYHGGAFFNAIGPAFDAMEKHKEVINADVLDAWFPPAPNVIEALQQNLAWISRTSPPTLCEGMTETISKARKIGEDAILPGAGSSDLMYLSLPRLLTEDSKVLVLDPTYGEYIHIFQHVIGCSIDRFLLEKEDNYEPDLERLLAKIVANKYDLIVLVNPNSPTGVCVEKTKLQAFLKQVPLETVVWIDETYIEYAGPGQSLEKFASRRDNIIICKSMSKMYSLSGVRAAYICSNPMRIDQLKRFNPPWSVSLPGQIAAVEALKAPDYYQARYEETHKNREELIAGLSEIPGIEVTAGITNCVMCHIKDTGKTAAAVVAKCREDNLFLRDARLMGTKIGDYVVRIAVKDGETNAKIVDIFRKAVLG